MFSHKPFVATNLNDNFLSWMFERIVHISEVNEDVFNISVMFPHLRTQFESRSSSLSRCFESPILLSLRSSSFKNCRAFEFVKDWVKEETSVMPQSFSLERERRFVIFLTFNSKFCRKKRVTSIEMWDFFHWQRNSPTWILHHYQIWQESSVAWFAHQSYTNYSRLSFNLCRLNPAFSSAAE